MRRRCFLALPLLFALPSAKAATRVEYPPVQPRPLRFPRDHGAHPDYRIEWWYVTGWLKRPNQREAGFQLTFFRLRSGHGEDNPSRFSPRQLLFAHAAIADPQYGRLRQAERSARADGQYAGFALEAARVWLGQWRLEQNGADEYRIEANGEDFAYSFALETRAPPLLHGLAGFSQKAPDARHASFYYSRPQLALRGELILPTGRERVTGLAWLDHEWSSELLPANAEGWDWLGINYNDGAALMAFQMRANDAEEPLWTAATWSPPAGRAMTFSAAAVRFTPREQWTSPRSRVRWPVSWQVTIGNRSITVVPLFADQELDGRRSTGVLYWEGAVRAYDEVGDPIGHGYLEMTGYGERIRLLG